LVLVRRAGIETGAAVTLTEKRAWCLLLATIGAYTWYVVTVLHRTGDGAVRDTPYVSTLLWSLGVSTAVNVCAEIVLSILNPRGARTKDERDRAIERFGDRVGQSFVVIGGVAALAMAMAQWHWFWIANVLYLCFAISAVLSSITRIVMNRKTVPDL
jgi:hypothetical protein